MKTLTFVTFLTLAASFAARSATLVSHWTMDNPSPYANEVSGGPEMVWDSATRAPATFDANETRLETSFDATRSTRIAAVSSSLDIPSFSFSMIIDPTDIIDFGAILQKESGASDSFADYQRVAWQVQHTTAGTIEFIVRGTDPGTKDFYGAMSVSSATSGFTGGASFDDPATYFQIAGGYDATTGSAFLYVTELGAFPVTSLTGSTASFDTGAVMDASALWWAPRNPESTTSAMARASTSRIFSCMMVRSAHRKSCSSQTTREPSFRNPEPHGSEFSVALCSLRRRRIRSPIENPACHEKPTSSFRPRIHLGRDAGRGRDHRGPRRGLHPRVPEDDRQRPQHALDLQHEAGRGDDHHQRRR
ncbi:MAG: hypothetical protein R2843_16255 [Thermomicrobiales bacterium]